MDSNSYQIENKERYTLVTVLEDKFTARVAPSLKAELAVLNNNGVKNIIFDMGKTSYCDSSGLSVILVANRVCNESKGCLIVCDLKPAVAKLIEISQLSSVLNITPTLSEAEDFLFMDEIERGLNNSEENLN